MRACMGCEPVMFGEIRDVPIANRLKPDGDWPNRRRPSRRSDGQNLFDLA